MALLADVEHLTDQQPVECCPADEDEASRRRDASQPLARGTPTVCIPSPKALGTGTAGPRSARSGKTSARAPTVLVKSGMAASASSEPGTANSQSSEWSGVARKPSSVAAV